MTTMTKESFYEALEVIRSRQEREKKKIVPKKNRFNENNPLKDKIDKIYFKQKLTTNFAQNFDSLDARVLTTMRTIVSKAYTDISGQMRRDPLRHLSREDREVHIDHMFECLNHYLQDAKKLMLDHTEEVEEVLKKQPF